jgi:hypothetical protein
MMSSLYEKYIGCSCTEHAVRRRLKKEDYVFNIESAKCAMKKGKDLQQLQQFIENEKQLYADEYKEPYYYPMTSCESKYFVNQYHQLGRFT